MPQGRAAFEWRRLGLLTDRTKLLLVEEPQREFCPVGLRGGTPDRSMRSDFGRRKAAPALAWLLGGRRLFGPVRTPWAGLRHREHHAPPTKWPGAQAPGHFILL